MVAPPTENDPGAVLREAIRLRAIPFASMTRIKICSAPSASSLVKTPCAWLGSFCGRSRATDLIAGSNIRIWGLCSERGRPTDRPNENPATRQPAVAGFEPGSNAQCEQCNHTHSGNQHCECYRIVIQPMQPLLLHGVPLPVPNCPGKREGRRPDNFSNRLEVPPFKKRGRAVRLREFPSSEHAAAYLRRAAPLR
jgi:hypothetical protein